MIEASETSGEESKDQEVTGAHAVTQGQRSQWTEHPYPVKLLSQQEGRALEAKNDTSFGAFLGVDPHAVAKSKAEQPIKTWLTIDAGDRTAHGIDKLAELLQATATVEQLKPIAN